MPVINCLELTMDAIASIHLRPTTTCDSIYIEARILLIDNASNDGTKVWAEKEEAAGHLAYIRNETRRSVAQSWNQGIGIASKDPECEYIAILNNDIVLHPKTLYHLMAFMDKTGYLMVTGDNIRDRMSVETLGKLELPTPFTDFDCWPIEGWRAEGPDFSCFMINRETVRVVGTFDENFKGGYCEDQDYHKRIQCAREHAQQHHDQGIDPNRIHAKRLTTAPYFHFASQTIARNMDVRHEISRMHATNREYYVRKWGADHPEAMDGRGYRTPFGDASKGWRDW